MQSFPSAMKKDYTTEPLPKGLLAVRYSRFIIQALSVQIKGLFHSIFEAIKVIILWISTNLYFNRQIKKISRTLLLKVVLSISCFAFVHQAAHATLIIDPPTITPYESVCTADGKIVVVGNATYEYILTGGGISQSVKTGSTTLTFDFLPKGNYNLQVINPATNEVANYPVTVTGNYEQNWTINPNVTYSSCSAGVPTVKIANLGITGTPANTQRPPFTYRISAKNGTLPANGLGMPAYAAVTDFSIPFPSGTGGSYEIQSMDACGNYKTVTVNVPSVAPGPSVSPSFVQFDNCNGDAQYKISATGGTSPYTFTVKSGPNQVGTSQTGADATFTLLALGIYVFSVTDQCGGVTEQTVTAKPYVAPVVNLQNGYGKCDPAGGSGTGSVAVNIDLNTVSRGPVTVELLSASGCTQTPAQTYPLNGSVNQIIFDNLIRPCTYTVKVTDGCNKIFTQDVILVAPSKGSMQCYKSFVCPADGSLNYRVRIGTFGNNYNATVPLVYEVIDSTTNTNITGYPVTLNNYGEIYPALPKGKYYIKITDACGTTCIDSVSVPAYKLPTVSVDVTNKCFGAGQVNVIGVNNQGAVYDFQNLYYYKITAGPTRVGDGPELDSPLHTGRFSNLVSGGTYTFQFNDGCKNVSTTVTMPVYVQPTWEIGYGALCTPKSTADLMVVNLQPATVVSPYNWRIISTNSELYGTTAPYNGTLPYPPSADGLGQTNPTFANLPARADGSPASYTIIGTDGCKNSFEGTGNVGTLPQETLIVNTSMVCSDGSTVLKMRPQIPVANATYQYFRDGVKIAQSTNLVTTINPALPGSYTVKVIASTLPDSSCFKVSTTFIITPAGSIKVTPLTVVTCVGEPFNITPSTTGSSAGTITYYTDKALSQPVADPTMATGGSKFYIKLVTSTVPICTIIDSVKITYTELKIAVAVTQATCTGPIANDNGKITVSSATNSDKYGISTAGAVSYDGANYSTATVYSAPADIKTNVPNTGGSYIIRFFNSRNTCFKDTTIVVAATASCVVVCVKPTITTNVTPATCNTSGIANSDGKITFTVINGDKYDVVQGATYAGTATYATASLLLNGTGSKTGLPNPSMATQYTIRVFNGSATCYKDTTVTLNQTLCPTGSIGDYVFLDKDNSGTNTAGDTPIAGVKVYLLNAAGVKIDSTITDATGKYLFSNLPLATYSIQFVAPAGQSFVTPNIGNDPTLSSSPGANGTTSPITLTAAIPNALTINAGLKSIIIDCKANVCIPFATKRGIK